VQEGADVSPDTFDSDDPYTSRPVKVFRTPQEHFISGAQAAAERRRTGMTTRPSKYLRRMQRNYSHLHMNSSALVLFQQSLKKFLQEFLEISAEYAQYSNRWTIESQDVRLTLRFLSQRFYSIIGARGGLNGDDDYEYQEEDEEEEGATQSDEDEENNLLEFEFESFFEEEIDEEESFGDDFRISLNGRDQDLHFKNYEGDLGEDFISLKSFYHLLTSCWNVNISPFINFSAFEAFHSVVEHHVILNLQGDPRSAMPYLSSAYPVP
jgi:histone H3/H4